MLNKHYMMVTVLINKKRPWKEIGDNERWRYHTRELMGRLGWGCIYTNQKYPNVIILCTETALDSRWIFDLFNEVPNRGAEFMMEYQQVNIDTPCPKEYTGDELFEEITKAMGIAPTAEV